MMMLATVGRCSSQLSATCGIGLAGFLGDLVERVDDPEEALLVEVRAGAGDVVGAGAGLGRLAAADLAGELAPAERAPDHGADALVAAERHAAPTRSRG